jgi:hypothetical protein
LPVALIWSQPASAVQANATSTNFLIVLSLFLECAIIAGKRAKASVSRAGSPVQKDSTNVTSWPSFPLATGKARRDQHNEVVKGEF